MECYKTTLFCDVDENSVGPFASTSSAEGSVCDEQQLQNTNKHEESVVESDSSFYYDAPQAFSNYPVGDYISPGEGCSSECGLDGTTSPIGKQLLSISLERPKPVKNFIDEYTYDDVNAFKKSSSAPEVHKLLPSDKLFRVQKRTLTKCERIKVKNECIRLWGNEVHYLAELLCFLQLCHRVNGPLLVSNCEEVIESYVNPSYGQYESSWIKYGPYMDVKRMFELKMFELSAPPNRLKVQPVDCILKAKFRVLSKGLISEIYKILLHSKKKTIGEMVELTTSFLEETDDAGRRDEIEKAVMKVHKVIAIEDGYIYLRNDDAFFVVTDIN